jgi:hypothetical protein
MTSVFAVVTVCSKNDLGHAGCLVPRKNVSIEHEELKAMKTVRIASNAAKS